MKQIEHPGPATEVLDPKCTSSILYWVLSSGYCSRTHVIPLNLATLANLHRQDARSVPTGGKVHRLLDGMHSKAPLAAAKEQRPVALHHARLPIEARLECSINIKSALCVPINDDDRHDDTLLVSDKMVVWDRNSLRVGPATSVLRHLPLRPDPLPQQGFVPAPNARPARV